jgi:hypothetical protein
MELHELTHDERLALVRLVELAVGSDAEVSEGEQDQIAQLVAAFGDEAYHDLVDEADERFFDEEALKTFLAGLSRQDARELIFGTVLSSAVPDVIDGRESSLLAWLAGTWSITVELEA